jgi:hypothetical protein
MVFELVEDSSSGVFESPAENRLTGNSTKLMIVTLQGPEDEIQRVSSRFLRNLSYR